MKSFSLVDVILLGLAASCLQLHVQAANRHVVQVGEAGPTSRDEGEEKGLVFKPNTVFAATGDTVQFDFYPKNHSVVQGDFKKACSPAAGGFYSGYIPSEEGKAATSFAITINNTDPIWIYCSYGDHCQDGMVGVINPGRTGTLDEYRKASADADENVEPNYPQPVGGLLYRDGKVANATGAVIVGGGESASSSDTAAAAVLTTTDSAGSTITTTVSSSASVAVTTFTDSSGSVVTSTASPTASASGGAGAGGAGGGGAGAAGGSTSSSGVAPHVGGGEVAGLMGLIVGVLGYLV